MEPGALILTTAVAGLVIGLVTLRIVDAWSDLAPMWQRWIVRRHLRRLARIASTIPPAAPVEITSSRADNAPHTSTDTSTISDNARAPYPYLTEREIVGWLAALKTADSWRYSANKIYTFVGGNRNDVMRWVRSVRGEEPPAADDEIVTPFAGRKTRAAYYPDTPELEYQPPEVLR